MLPTLNMRISKTFDIKKERQDKTEKKEHCEKELKTSEEQISKLELEIVNLYDSMTEEDEKIAQLEKELADSAANSSLPDKIIIKSDVFPNKDGIDIFTETTIKPNDDVEIITEKITVTQNKKLNVTKNLYGIIIIAENTKSNEDTEISTQTKTVEKNQDGSTTTKTTTTNADKTVITETKTVTKNQDGNTIDTSINTTKPNETTETITKKSSIQIKDGKTIVTTETTKTDETTETTTIESVPIS